MEMKKTKEDLNSRMILLILTLFSAAFIIAAFIARDRGEMISGLIRISTSPSQFTMDYFKLGGLSASFLNTGLTGLACCCLLFFTRAKCTGLTVAAYWLTTGFATFGMTLLTIWPFFLGVFIYSRIKKKSFGSVANLAMFSTALAPFAGELMFRYPGLQARGFSFWGLVGAILLGIVVGCVMPALCAHSPAFHKGYDLYSAGPAAGFLAFLICCILYRSPGIELPVNTDLGEGERLFVNLFFILIFLLCLAAAWLTDHDCFRNYRALWKSSGYKTDYTDAFGMSTTLVNMGLYGLFILLYYNVVHGFALVNGSLVVSSARFTGATMGAIMCMFAFNCQGAQPRTVFPVMVGYALASLLPLLATASGMVSSQNWTLTTQAVLVGLCFASGLAPVSGRFGFGAGVIGGALHAFLVMSVPLLHGGFCLYNGGFTAGIVCFLLVPVLEDFTGAEKRERR
ncbi:MAG: DUF1576 domain-containing protein [Lachnospiraceae bacterium]|nr:DUF1576 domain-containing protein [Lachnospiraceae bacterium]